MSKKAQKNLLYVLVVLSLALAALFRGEVVMQQEASKPELPQENAVLKVVDGDTVAVLLNNKSQTIRLIGINTPETVDPRKEVECFGKEASDKAKELLTGKKVIIEKDETQDEYDKYNRLLAYIYLEDGTFYNKYMIEEGYAYEYTYDVPYKYQQEFKEAQKKAQELKKGLWGENMCGHATSSVVSLAFSMN